MDNREELRALIEQYNREMMAQYSRKTTTSQADSSTTETLDESESTTPPDFQTDDLIDTGGLQVRVSTEKQAIPIPGAVVTITRADSEKPELIQTIVTDGNGLTPIVDLKTKDRRLSLEPNNPEPYTTYTVDVNADGYFNKRFVNIPIYGGVTAIQSVSMIPLPEYGDPNVVLSYQQSSPNL